MILQLILFFILVYTTYQHYTLEKKVERETDSYKQTIMSQKSFRYKSITMLISTFFMMMCIYYLILM